MSRSDPRGRGADPPRFDIARIPARAWPHAPAPSEVTKPEEFEMARIGVDVGGTNTGLVLESADFRNAKVACRS